MCGGILRTYIVIAKNPQNSSTLVCPPEEGDDERRREVKPFPASSPLHKERWVGNSSTPSSQGRRAPQCPLLAWLHRYSSSPSSPMLDLDSEISLQDCYMRSGGTYAHGSCFFHIPLYI